MVQNQHFRDGSGFRKIGLTAFERTEDRETQSGE